MLENAKPIQSEGGDKVTAYEKYERLKNERNVSNYQVSKDTGIPQATLSEWKDGKYTPKVDKMMVLATYFGVPVTELIGD